MHTVNMLSLPAQRCPLMLEMSGSGNIPRCPCMAVCLIELSHDPLSSGYAYDSVPPGQAMMEHDKRAQHCQGVPGMPSLRCMQTNGDDISGKEALFLHTGR